MGKRLLALVISMVLVVGCCGEIFAADTTQKTKFLDVVEYEEAIQLLSNLEIIKGKSETRFDPNANVTRWQMALLLSKLVSGMVDNRWQNAPGNVTFLDVKPQHYIGAIAYASSAGLIKGTKKDGTEFLPENGIQYQDGLTMAIRALGYQTAQLDAGYPMTYIIEAERMGLLKGIDILDYNATMTRGQTAQLLYNMLFAPKKDKTTYAKSSFQLEETKLVLTGSLAKNSLQFHPLTSENYDGKGIILSNDKINIVNPNDKIGTAYTVLAKQNYSTIYSIKELPNQTFTKGLTFSSSTNTLTLDDTTYQAVEKFSASTPLNEIMVFNDTLFSTFQTVSVKDMLNTNAYYTFTAFDDDEDGIYNRAIYKPYSFGKYEKTTDGKITIANNELASNLSIIGESASLGDYVLYAYHPQNRTLEIEKVFTSKTGTVTAINSAQHTILIDTVSYSIGLPNLPGATYEDIFAKGTFQNTQSPISYVTDGTILFAVDTGISSTGIAVFTNVTALSSGNVNLQIYRDGIASTIPVSTINGLPAYTNLGLLHVGDLLEVSHSVTGEYRVKTNASYLYTTQKTQMLLQSGEFAAIVENGNAIPGFPPMKVSANTVLLTYSASTGLKAPVKLADALRSGAITLAEGTSIQLWLDASKTVTCIYINGNAGVTNPNTNFDSIVYVDTSVKFVGGSAVTGSTTPRIEYTYSNAWDITTGTLQTIKFTWESSQLLPPSIPLATGYYSCSNGVLVNPTTPLVAPLTAGTRVFTPNATLNQVNSANTVTINDSDKTVYSIVVLETVNGTLNRVPKDVSYLTTLLKNNTAKGTATIVDYYYDSPFGTITIVVKN